MKFISYFTNAQTNVANLKLKGDPERLLQALLNVLDNAIKHSKPGTKVIVEGNRDGKRVFIRVRDQ